MGLIMKNLPEKIYLNLNMTPQEVVETKDKDFHEATKTWEITWSEEMLSEHDPEYIRKDAFVDRACSFFRQSHYLYILDGVELKHFIDDFRKVMKGE